MPDERRLQQTLWELQKRFGDQVVSTLAARDAARDAIATGYPALDAALHNGGLLRGHISALVGKPSCGATTLALHLLACAQGRAETGVYLDYSQTFDPHYAAHCGVDVNRLLLVQPKDGLQMLDISRDLVQTSFPALVVLDLLTTQLSPYPSALPIPLRRLHEAFTGSRTAVLFLLRTLPELLDAYTQTHLQLQRLDWLYAGRDVIGYQTRVSILKDKPGSGGNTVTLDITFDPAVEGDE